MNTIEKRANDPVQVLSSQKKVSFDETNLNDPNASQTPISKKYAESEAEIVQSLQPSTIKVTGGNDLNENSNEESSAASGGVVKPMKDDILSGRGAGVNLHPGNVYFRSLIQKHKQSYIEGDPGAKKRIIKQIHEMTTKRGRFLKQDPETELWQPITVEEARKKTGQALRENAPALKKQRSDIKQKLQLAQQLKAVLPDYLSTPRNETESSSLGSRSPPEMMTPSYAPPAMMSAHATNLLWSRMNMLQEKQEQLKRKQRELEDEQNQLTQYFYQMTATLSKPAPMTPMNMLFRAANDSGGSDSETDQMYDRSQKRRRIIFPGH